MIVAAALGSSPVLPPATFALVLRRIVVLYAPSL
jgi:hypothetical protein